MILPHNGANRATQNTPIFVHHNGREIAIGRVENHVFIKNVHSTKHFLRTPRAIALDAQSIVDAENAGATSIRIIDNDTRDIFTATFTTFKSKCFVVNRGDGSQRALAIDWWSRNGQQPVAEARESARKSALNTVQLALFDMPKTEVANAHSYRR